MHSILAIIQHYLVSYGYWAVLLGLLGENAGLPLPGETILLLASFLAYQHHQLQLPWIIVVGVCAATLGDNLGYVIGYFGGRPLLHKWKHAFRIGDADIKAAEDLLRRRGWVAVFLARFIAGMRIIAGPLAGGLRMPWKKFVTANATGAVVWVTAIALVGYLFGSKFDTVVRLFKEVEIAILAAIVIGWYLWRRYRNRFRHRQQEEQHQPAD